ncbi:hypothetical protein BD770DRAFT_413592 [Pilaira anomala]|nr:hypothetical protein BD770DRAFT_413592 [Pilaira anomala]
MQFMSSLTIRSAQFSKFSLLNFVKKHLYLLSALSYVSRYLKNEFILSLRAHYKQFVTFNLSGKNGNYTSSVGAESFMGIKTGADTYTSFVLTQAKYVHLQEIGEPVSNVRDLYIRNFKPLYISEYEYYIYSLMQRILILCLRFTLNIAQLKKKVASIRTNVGHMPKQLWNT